MSELQISLLVIGIAVVLVVYAYSWWQQRRYRRMYGAAFKHMHEDALYRPSTEESIPGNPVPEKPAGESLAGNMKQTLPADVLTGGQPQHSQAADETCALLDTSTDYIAMIPTKSLAGADALARLWQQRFDFGKDIHVCGLDVAGGTWEKVIPESRLPYAAFKLALQLVNRAGAVSEARLADFRDLARMMATQLQADVVLPDVAEAAARSLELDKFCAAVDQMIGLNIFPRGERVLSGNEVARSAEKLDLSLQPDGSFHMRDTRGHTLFSLGNFDNTPFQHHTLDQQRIDGLTLLLDVPRVEQPTLRFDQMVELARKLAHDLGAEVMDDRHLALSEAGIALIREQISAIESKMLAGNIVPGSAQARRLFS